MIDVQTLDILDSFRFISLSSKFEDAETILVGKWIVYKQSGFFNENGVVELEEGGSIGFSTFSKSRKGWKEERDWSFVDLRGQNYYSQNSFNLLGISTMEIVFIDESIIYAKGYANNIIIFIKEEAKDIFKSNDDILVFFSKIENYWIKDLQRLKGLIPNDYINWANGPQIPIVLIVAFLLSGYIATRTESFIMSIIACILSFFFVGIFTLVCSLLITRLLLKGWLRHYKQEHPQDKLANFITIDYLK